MGKESKNLKTSQMQKTSTLTISKDAADRLSITKDLLKRQFGESFSYSDIINTSLVLMNKELFEKNNPEVVGYLKIFKQYRLLLAKAERLREMGLDVSMPTMEPPSTSDFESLLSFVISVPPMAPQQKQSEASEK
ncbi:hypothetical protein APY94_03790 [Thermococcus celericrescens]|uniref:Uncharacterized protein n=1 Tax=Thermococcus celericrescens TaxID=227598 RepID=A0A100XYI4_9EURY|nr:hypothetical protein [Thermococcus celericrescens]KUH34005.1 hypothetical protein APY94_03790 [Thermococcus celericrescens]